MPFVRLRDILVEELKSRGIERLGTKLKKILSSSDPIATIAAYFAAGKVEICEAEKPLPFSITLDGKFVNAQPQAYVGECGRPLLEREEIIKNNFPYIIIDCRFWDRHLEKEKRKLKIQIRQTLGVVRRYMWDDRLIVTGKIDRDETLSSIPFHSSTEEFVNERGIKKVIVLDPMGDEEFDGEEAECYVVGGIVDKKGDKVGLTSKLADEIEKSCDADVRRMRITLRGDTLGVPDRINHIAEIVLKTVFDGKSVEEAVLDVQPPIVAKWRLRKEISKYSIKIKMGGKTYRVVPRDVLNEFGWLNLREEDFYEVCSDYRFLVVSRRLLDAITITEDRDLPSP